jgi:hypothetical protein
MAHLLLDVMGSASLLATLRKKQPINFNPMCIYKDLDDYVKFSPFPPSVKALMPPLNGQVILLDKYAFMIYDSFYSRNLICWARSEFIGFVPHSVRSELSAGWNFF